MFHPFLYIKCCMENQKELYRSITSCCERWPLYKPNSTMWIAPLPKFLELLRNRENFGSYEVSMLLFPHLHPCRACTQSKFVHIEMQSIPYYRLFYVHIDLANPLLLVDLCTSTCFLNRTSPVFLLTTLNTHKCYYSSSFQYSDKYSESHLNPSAYPILRTIEHMNNSMGLEELSGPCFSWL